MLNTPAHLSCFHPKFLSLDEILYMYVNQWQINRVVLRLRVLIINFPHFYPCRNGTLEIVKCLIEVQRCSAGCTDDSGQTPLHLAC